MCILREEEEREGKEIRKEERVRRRHGMRKRELRNDGCNERERSGSGKVRYGRRIVGKGRRDEKKYRGSETDG